MCRMCEWKRQRKSQEKCEQLSTRGYCSRPSPSGTERWGGLASWTPQEFQPSIVDEPGEGPRVELAPNQLDGNAVWIALGASFLLLLLTGFGE